MVTHDESSFKGRESVDGAAVPSQEDVVVPCAAPAETTSVTETTSANSGDVKDSSRAPKYGGLTDEDIAKLKKAQKRNLIFAIILGMILVVCGFYAGKAARSHTHSSVSTPIVSVVNADEFYTSIAGGEVVNVA